MSSGSHRGLIASLHGKAARAPRPSKQPRSRPSRQPRHRSPRRRPSRRRPSRRWLASIAIAVAATAPAVALGGSGGSGGPIGLAVDASLRSCARYVEQVVCRIDITYEQAPGATRYTATVTAPDGSHAGGELSGGSGSMWVPYGGDGRYVVRVDAYGPGHAVVASDEAAPEGSGPDDSTFDAQAGPEAAGSPPSVQGEEGDQAGDDEGAGDVPTGDGGGEGDEGDAGDDGDPAEDEEPDCSIESGSDEGEPATGEPDELDPGACPLP